MTLGVAVGLLAVGCSDAEVDSGSGPVEAVSSDGAAASPGQSAECRTVISPEAIQAFGWKAGEQAGEAAGRCEWSGEGNVVTVGRRTDLDAGGSRDEARSALTDACAHLGGDERTVDHETDWLAPGTEACVQELPATETTGVVEMFLLTDDSAVVEIRVAIGQPVNTEGVRAGLTELVAGAQSAW